MTDTFTEATGPPGTTPAEPGAPLPDPAEQLRQMASYRVNRYTVALVVVVGLLSTFVVAFVNVANARSERDDRFNQASVDGAARVAGTLDGFAETLVGFRGLFASTNGASRSEFDDYVSATGATERQPGTQAVGWAPVVPASQVDDLEDEVAADGFDDFAVRPDSTMPDALPIVYLEPLEGNEGAFGFDVGADERGRNTVDRAASSGEPTVGGLLAVPDAEGVDQRAFNVFLALYDGGGVPGDEDVRDDRFEGVAMVLVSAAQAFAPSFGEDSEVRVEIYDLGAIGGPPDVEPTPRNLIYDSDDTLTAPSGSTGLHQSIESTIDGRRWLLYFQPGPAFSAPQGNIPWLAVLAGLLITGLIAALIVSFAQTRQRAAALAEEVTASLRARESELRRANEDIVRSNRELERYASIAAHDLQEPLRSLLAYASVLERRYGETLDPEVQDQISRMARAAERMRSLVVDLLAYARGESGERKTEMVDLDEAVRIAIDDLSVLINETGAVIRAGALPTVPGNRRELIGVFSNLLSNALKYRGDDPPEVRIAAQERGDEWVIGVKDNGIGIAPAYHERIFELFRRLEKRSSDSGTGLGLAICARTIAQHGGRIWVESEEGEGATFWFTLPANPPGPGLPGLPGGPV